jgi:hypothetical protein
MPTGDIDLKKRTDDELEQLAALRETAPRMSNKQRVRFERLDRASRDRDSRKIIDEKTIELTNEVLGALAPVRDPTDPRGWRERPEAEGQAVMDKFVDGLGEHFGLGPKPR